MIFKVHNENIFGVKKLTKADLGLGTSHQTHIGLYDGILAYLEDTDEIKEAYLIFKNQCERLDCYFDRIENPDGTFRSPKIRVGTTDSIVKEIRAKSAQITDDLYLLWFSLDNGELLFILFEENSDDYRFFNSHGVLDGKFRFTAEILEYVFTRFDSTNENILVELELNSQGVQPRRHYRRIDIERANELFRQTGRTGEELINKYLERLKHCSKIKDFSWMNKSRESGLPYDFCIIQNDSHNRFVDVKTTRFKFDSPIVFSSQEALFITNETVLYSVFRAYNIVADTPFLRICGNCRDKMGVVLSDYTSYCSVCQGHGYEVQSSFLVKPTDSSLRFSNDINLFL